MPAAIPYIRFSSARQASGTSTERQHQMVMVWMGQNSDYTLSDLTYRDLGKSGYKGEHIKDGGGFAKLLAAVKAGAIKPGDVVLVEAIDRAGRMETADMLGDLILPILRAGISIVTLDDNTVYTKGSINTPQIHLLMAKIQAAWSYSKQLSDRITANYGIRRQKAMDGEPVKRWVPIWLTVEGELKTNIAPYIEQAFEWYVSGIGKTTIANRLRGSGVPELATCSGPTVEAWLRNNAAIGFWGDIPNVYPAVVSPELFMQAQQRKKLAATKPRERTSKNFLVGLVKCGVCGSNYIIHHKDGKPNNMRCGTHHRLKLAGCKNAETVPYQVVHHLYLSTAYLSINQALAAIQLTETERRKLVLTAERDELSVSIARLVKLLSKAESQELEVEYQSAVERRAAIESELNVLNRVSDAEPQTTTSLFVGYEMIVEHDRLFLNDPVQLSALLKQAGYQIVVQPGKALHAMNGGEVDCSFIQYVGVLRSGNETLGYRLNDGEGEYVIAQNPPTIQTLPANDSEPHHQNEYLLNRNYSIVKHYVLDDANFVTPETTQGTAVALDDMSEEEQRLFGYIPVLS